MQCETPTEIRRQRCRPTDSSLRAPVRPSESLYNSPAVHTELMMVGLKSLAFELLHRDEITLLVCDLSPPTSQCLASFEVKALCVMRSVCQLTNAVVEPVLFRHLVMTMNSADHKLKSLCHTQLRDLAEGRTAASAHAKTLTLRICGLKWHESVANVVDLEELALALGALCNLNSVIWMIGQPISPAATANIVQCLSGLPQLVDLEIDCRYGSFPCLSTFKGLQRLSISGTSSGCDGLSTLVANSPGLLHLNIEGRRPIRPIVMTPFAPQPIATLPIPLPPDIFALVSSGRTMGIKSLGLSWFQMQIGSDMLPHLQSLESYRLQVSDTYGRVQAPPFENSNSWRSLRISGLNLRHLDVDYVDRALVDYLASSSGLETLRFTALYTHGHDLPEGLAHRFFTVLPRHSKSLKSLSILVPPENMWCFHTDYISSLLLCKKLDMLSLSIAVRGNDTLSHRSDVHALIDAARHLPHLQTLELHTQIVGYRCGTGHVAAFRRAQAALKSAVLSFLPGPISSNEGYPEISIMGNFIKYTMMEGDNGSGWRYECSYSRRKFVPCWPWEYEIDICDSEEDM